MKKSTAVHRRLAQHERNMDCTNLQRPMRRQAFIYARVATTQGDFEKDISLNDQVARCRAYCEEKGYPIQDVSMEACSGILPYEKRNGFMSLLGEMSKVDNSILVVTQRNRLARDMIVMLRTIAAIRQCGGSVEFIQPGWTLPIT